MVLVFLSILSFSNQEPQRVHITGRAQGTTYSVTYYSNEALVTSTKVDSLLSRLDESLSIYQSGSLINRFNASKKGLLIDSHLLAVVTRAIHISRETNGLFDITVMPLTQAWGFGTKKGVKPPGKAQLQKILPCVGIKHLRLNDNFLSKDLPCTMIDVNGIAQGYSVDKLASLLESYGIGDYIVEIGGEIRVKGLKPGNQQMKIGIESPATDEMEAGIYKRILSIDSGAITTSGNYRKFYESKGKVVTHLFDPRTGYSINNELVAATVYAPDAITADGFDNALMNMGLEKALSFIETQPQLGAYFIYRDATGAIKDSASTVFKKLIVSDK